jgi:hypothetical protein
MPHINPGYVVGHGDAINAKQACRGTPAARPPPACWSLFVGGQALSRHCTQTSGLPRYTRDEVAQHDGSIPADNGKPNVWVTYKVSGRCRMAWSEGGKC